MKNEELNQWIIATEKSSRQVEVIKPSEPQLEYTMWLPQDQFLTLNNPDFELVPIENEEQWQRMLKLRTMIESEFGLTDHLILQQLVRDIQTKTQQQQGQWFLAQFKGEWVGEIGIIPFPFQQGVVGRLKDVDIVPSYQGQGLGNLLLQAVCAYAKSQNYQALCLMARAEDWPFQWYQRLGFQVMGEARV